MKKNKMNKALVAVITTSAVMGGGYFNFPSC